jgi:hypothetical protein
MNYDYEEDNASNNEDRKRRFSTKWVKSHKLRATRGLEIKDTEIVRTE